MRLDRLNTEVTGNDAVVRGGDGAGKKRRELTKNGGEWLGVRRGVVAGRY